MGRHRVSVSAFTLYRYSFQGVLLFLSRLLCCIPSLRDLRRERAIGQRFGILRVSLHLSFLKQPAGQKEPTDGIRHRQVILGVRETRGSVTHPLIGGRVGE